MLREKLNDQAVAPDSLAGLVGMAGQLPLADGGDVLSGHALKVKMKAARWFELALGG
jgi:hypothetical protein